MKKQLRKIKPVHTLSRLVNHVATSEIIFTVLAVAPLSIVCDRYVKGNWRWFPNMPEKFTL